MEGRFYCSADGDAMTPEERRSAEVEAALPLVAAHVEKADGLAQKAVFHFEPGDRMHRLLSSLAGHVASARVTLRKVGVTPSPTPMPVDPLSLPNLAALDTPNARQLLQALEDLLPLAEAVDAERGRVLPEEIPLRPGESRGTDLAETISLMILRLGMDIEGGQGRE